MYRGKPLFDPFLCHGGISFRDTRSGLLYEWQQMVSTKAACECPLWVKSGHWRDREECPLYT